MKRLLLLPTLLLATWLGAQSTSSLEQDFRRPPDAARPWVYWIFMDGNMTREGMTADLEAMHRAGIGGVIMFEVDLGLPRGPVKFMTPEWQELFAHAVREAERLGIEIALCSGPGWCGTGGPWVRPEDSMQHLVASETHVLGPQKFNGTLPRPQPRRPYFGEGTLTPELAKQWREFHRDVAVLANPMPPYNLLVTREALLLVPRMHEKWQDVSVNSLGYAGSLFVRDREQIERLRACGPLAVLAAVGRAPG